jgi:hypothetical protein
MIRVLSWRRVVPAVCTVATLVMLLYTIGAPFEHGG